MSHKYGMYSTSVWLFFKTVDIFFFLNENSLSLYMDESQTFLKVILTINYKSTIKLLIKDLSNSKCDNDNKSLSYQLLFWKIVGRYLLFLPFTGISNNHYLQIHIDNCKVAVFSKHNDYFCATYYYNHFSTHLLVIAWYFIWKSLPQYRHAGILFWITYPRMRNPKQNDIVPSNYK